MPIIAMRALMEQAGFVFPASVCDGGREEATSGLTANPSDCQKRLYTEGYQIYIVF